MARFIQGELSRVDTGSVSMAQVVSPMEVTRSKLSEGAGDTMGMVSKFAVGLSDRVLSYQLEKEKTEAERIAAEQKAAQTNHLYTNAGNFINQLFSEDSGLNSRQAKLKATTGLAKMFGSGQYSMLSMDERQKIFTMFSGMIDKLTEEKSVWRETGLATYDPVSGQMSFNAATDEERAIAISQAAQVKFATTYPSATLAIENASKVNGVFDQNIFAEKMSDFIQDMAKVETNQLALAAEVTRLQIAHSRMDLSAKQKQAVREEASEATNRYITSFLPEVIRRGREYGLNTNASPEQIEAFMRNYVLEGTVNDPNFYEALMLSGTNPQTFVEGVSSIVSKAALDPIATSARQQDRWKVEAFDIALKLEFMDMFSKFGEEGRSAFVLQSEGVDFLNMAMFPATANMFNKQKTADPSLEAVRGMSHLNALNERMSVFEQALGKEKVTREESQSVSDLYSEISREITLLSRGSPSKLQPYAVINTAVRILENPSFKQRFPEEHKKFEGLLKLAAARNQMDLNSLVNMAKGNLENK